MEKLPNEVLYMIASRFEYCIPYDARFDRTASKYSVTTAHARPVEWKSDLKTLRSLRLTCRALNYPATRALFNIATVAWYPGNPKKYPLLRQSLTDRDNAPLIAYGSHVAPLIKSLKVDFSAVYKAPSWFRTADRATSCFEIAQDDGHEMTQNARVLIAQLKQVLEALPKLASLALLSGSWESRSESHKLSFAPVLDLSLIEAFEDTVFKALNHMSLVHLTKLHLQLSHSRSYFYLSKSLPKVFRQLEESYLSIGDGTVQDLYQRMYMGDRKSQSQRESPRSNLQERHGFCCGTYLLNVAYQCSSFQLLHLGLHSPNWINADIPDSWIHPLTGLKSLYVSRANLPRKQLLMLLSPSEKMDLK